MPSIKFTVTPAVWRSDPACVGSEGARRPRPGRRPGPLHGPRRPAAASPQTGTRQIARRDQNSGTTRCRYTPPLKALPNLMRLIPQDKILWLFGSGFPKRRDMLKPAYAVGIFGLGEKPPESL